ncbi:MAG: ferrous iron transport protein A, partial [Clostridia bacterium]|nr:ferrous iron transport protein A [Clostridia bacterium]
MTLKELPIGRSATVVEVGGTGALRQHLLDMGIVPGVSVSMVKHAPLGDPVEIRIHSYELTLRLADAAKIKVAEQTDEPTAEDEEPPKKAATHPGFGESGKNYHVKAD